MIKKALKKEKEDTFIVFSSVTKQGKEEAWQAIEALSGLSE